MESYEVENGGKVLPGTKIPSLILSFSLIAV